MRLGLGVHSEIVGSHNVDATQQSNPSIHTYSIRLIEIGDLALRKQASKLQAEVGRLLTRAAQGEADGSPAVRLVNSTGQE